jgi:hypothetical protein
MKLIFDNTTELSDFLLFCAKLGNLTAHESEMQPDDAVDPTPEGDITSSAALTEERKPEPDDAQAPRRKRRTKAEMAAAAQTELTAVAQSAQTEAQAAAEAKAPVIARDTTQADATLTDAEIARRAQELGEVDPAKHLNDARAFIAAHGLTAYLQTQQMAKVSENAVTYTPEERARHTAAMQLFESMKTGAGTAAA